VPPPTLKKVPPPNDNTFYLLCFSMSCIIINYHHYSLLCISTFLLLIIFFLHRNPTTFRFVNDSTRVFFSREEGCDHSLRFECICTEKEGCSNRHFQTTGVVTFNICCFCFAEGSPRLVRYRAKNWISSRLTDGVASRLIGAVDFSKTVPGNVDQKKGLRSLKRRAMIFP